MHSTFFRRVEGMRHAAGQKFIRVQTLLVLQVVFFQESGPEILWRSDNVRPALRRKVHEIPVWPHRIDMIPRQFGSPEMENLSVLPLEYMHHRPLHVIGVSLAFVIGL